MIIHKHIFSIMNYSKIFEQQKLASFFQGAMAYFLNFAKKNFNFFILDLKQLYLIQI